MLRISKKEGIYYKKEGQANEITIALIEQEEMEIDAYLPNNYGDYTCEGITEDTEQEESHPDWYRFHEGNILIHLENYIFGKFMNNEEYYTGNIKRNTNMEKVMRRIGEGYEEANKRRDEEFFKIIKQKGETLPRYSNTKHERVISDEVVMKQQERREALKNREFEKVRILTKEIKKQTNKDNKNMMRDMVKKEMDVRDKFLGIKCMARGYKAKPYNLRDEKGDSVPFKQQAQFAAKEWEKKIWKDERTEKEKRNDDKWEKEMKGKLVHDKKLTFDQSPIKLEEMSDKFKKRKATGPDDEEMEIYQSLDMENRTRLLEVINEWWIHNEFPAEKLYSRIVFIYKKGKPSDILNYRPIALTNAVYKIFTSIIQKRMARAMDHVLQKTQYGFRKERSTADAIYLIRRIIEQGEKSNPNKSPALKFVTLDWEKAFDSVRDEALFAALERLGVDKHYVEVIKRLYACKKYKVELNGETPEDCIQETGIRQGCPLSPYLFLCIMTVLFHDIKKNKELRDQLIKNRINETLYDEILYADDTILFSEDTNTLQSFLWEVEKEGRRYGLKLNKGKCEALNTEGSEEIKFGNGKTVKRVTESSYLGCRLNDKANIQRELNKRLADVYRTYKRLDPYWKNLSIPCKEKLIVHEMIIRAKLFYGFESAQVNDTVFTHRIDPFYKKGLRNILRMQPKIDEITGNPVYPSDEKLYDKANAMFGIRKKASPKRIVPPKEYYNKQRYKLVMRIINAEKEDYKRTITMHEHDFSRGKKRRKAQTRVVEKGAERVLG